MIKKIEYGYYQSPIELIEIAVYQDQITSLKFVKHQNYQISENFVIKQCQEQLDQYFNKQRQQFDLPFAIQGTIFQELVWSKAWKIPYGSTVSYQEIAHEINNPKAVRAVGSALKKNPLIIIIPCHRVIGSNKKLVNYNYGLDKKAYLLQLETNL